MHRGYVRLWRKTLDSGLMQNPEIFTFFSWCLMKATHKPIKQMVGHQLVSLQPGQFVFGRKSAAQALGTTERKIRTAKAAIEKMGISTSKTTNKYSIISIVNWPSYQRMSTANDQQNDQEATSRRPAGDHKQELKNLKTEKVKPNGRFAPPSVDEVRSYCIERKNGIDPSAFIDHYEANGWMRGKSKIKSWKACVRTWEKNNPQPHDPFAGMKRL